MTTLESTCSDFYKGFANLNRSSQKFPIWWSGSSYTILIDKTDKTRKELWNDLLSKYYLPYSSLALSEDEGIKVNARNTFFHSWCEIIDKKNNTRVTASTPWYSAFLRLFFGGDLVILKMKKNYTPFSKKIKKAGKLLGASIKLGYNYLKK